MPTPQAKEALSQQKIAELDQLVNALKAGSKFDELSAKLEANTLRLEETGENSLM